VSLYSSSLSPWQDEEALSAFSTWLLNQHKNQLHKMVLWGSGLKISLLMMRFPEELSYFAGACYTDQFYVESLQALELNTLQGDETLITLGSMSERLPDHLQSVKFTGLHGRWASFQNREFEQDLELEWQQLKTELNNALAHVELGLLLVEAQWLEPLVGKALDFVGELLPQSQLWCTDAHIEVALSERGKQVRLLELEVISKEDDARLRYQACLDGLKNNTAMAALLAPEDSWPLFNGLYYDRLVFYALNHLGLDSWAAAQVEQTALPDVVVHVGPLRSQVHLNLLRQFQAVGVRLVLIPTHLEANLFGPRLVRALKPDHVIQLPSMSSPLALTYMDTLRGSCKLPPNNRRLFLVVFDLKYRWEARAKVAELIFRGEQVAVKCRSDWMSHNGLTTERVFCDAYLKLLPDLRHGGYELLGDDVTLAEAVVVADEIYVAKGSAAGELACYLGQKVGLFDRGGKFHQSDTLV
jgi:hypothetical protein